MTNTTNTAGSDTGIPLDKLTRYDHRGALMVPDGAGDYFLVPDVRDALARRAAPSPQIGQKDERPSDNFAVRFIEQRAEQYLQDHASTEPDTGATVFHYGEAGREYHSTLVELADDIRAAQAKVCTVPPAGWSCTRVAGHDGPCAAIPDDRAALAQAAPADLTDEQCDAAIAAARDALAAKLNLSPSDMSTDTKGHWSWGRALIRAGHARAAVVAIPAPAVWYVANGNRVERVHGGLLAQTYIHAEAVFIANALNWFTASPAQPAGAGAPSDLEQCIRALAMLVAEEGIKEGRGYMQSVASDRVRSVVDGVLSWDIGRGAVADIEAAAQLARQGAAPTCQPGLVDSAARLADSQGAGAPSPMYRIEEFERAFAHISQQLSDAFEVNADLRAQLDAARHVGKHLYDAVSQGAAPAQAEPVARDWIEDSPHENGNYQCKCSICDHFFIGHKRRVVCKACATAPAPAPVAQAAICQPGGEPYAYEESDGDSSGLIYAAWFALGRGKMDPNKTYEPLYRAPVPASPQSPQAAPLGICCYGGPLKPKSACASCAAWKPQANNTGSEG